MQTDIGLDTGDVMLTQTLDILPDETAGELTLRLADLGGDLLLKALEQVENNTQTYTKQDESKSSYYPMLSKEMGKIDFNNPAGQVHNLVRGFYSWPAAYTFLGEKRIKVYRTELCELSGEAGSVLRNDNTLIVGCGNGSVRLCEIQLEGGKRTTDTEFLRGNKIEIGYKF
jgi:methionyl-tRNA formyltransferase